MRVVRIVAARFTPLLAGLLAALSVAHAQQRGNNPRIGYAYPAGGQQGMTFAVELGGQWLVGVTNAFVSGNGVHATVVGHEGLIPPKELNELRDKLAILQARRQVMRGNPRPPILSNYTGKIELNVADLKLLDDIRRKLDNFQKRRQIPALSENVILRVHIEPDAAPGQRELRLETANGLSNPLAFHVGQLTEFVEAEGKAAGNKTGLAITLPSIVNGQIMPGEVDRYHFPAKKGDRLTIVANARSLIPYLPDAVPGWFQATLALYDAKGKELSYADDFRFSPDPVLYYEIPADGEYTVEIKDSIYRGRDDFVYRITIGELPFVTSIFPLGCAVGAQATVAVKGWNLPVQTVPADARGREPGVVPLFVWDKAKFSNFVPFAMDTLPEVLEKEQKDPQPVTLPVIINGRIDQPGDRDVFRLEGKAGQEIVAEVRARRLNSPLDSMLRVLDAAGNVLAVNDDSDDKGAGLETHHADSYLRVTLPTNGAYFVQISDTQQKGGPEYAYRLRLSAPIPDFELRVTPASINARVGQTVPVTVFALRRDGFTNEIALALKDAPAGFKLSGATIPAGQDSVKLTLTAPTTPVKDPVNLTFTGRATIQGRDVVHAAVPAEDMMQAFIYRHLVPAQELKVAVVGRFAPRAEVRLLTKTPVMIPRGGTARVLIGMPATTLLGKIHLELADAPDGLTLKSMTPGREGLEVVFQTEADKPKPGLKGNLIVKAFGERAPEPGKTVRRIPLTAIPAIPYEITGVP